MKIVVGFWEGDPESWNLTHEEALDCLKKERAIVARFDHPNLIQALLTECEGEAESMESVVLELCCLDLEEHMQQIVEKVS